MFCPPNTNFCFNMKPDKFVSYRLSIANENPNVTSLTKLFFFRHINFRTKEHLFLPLILKKILAKLLLIFAWSLHPLNQWVGRSDKIKLLSTVKKLLTLFLNTQSPPFRPKTKAFILTAWVLRHTAWMTAFSCNKLNLCFNPISVVRFW